MVVIDTDNNMLITRGDTATIDISIKDDNDQEYALQPGDKIIFSVKKIATQSIILLQKELTTKQLVLDSADTSGYSFGTYKYDMTLVTASEVCTFICFKDFIIGEEVHSSES